MTYDPKQLENQIKMYYHCGLCLKEKPADKSPQEWGMNEVGASPLGFQVWCRRHDCNVVHVDLEGQKFSAYTERKGDHDKNPREPLTPEEQKKAVEYEKEIRSRRMYTSIDSMMHKWPEEFAAILPTVIATWIHFNSKSDQERQTDLQELTKVVQETMLEIKKNVRDEENL